jgi:flagellar L-ring protein precursor FlgH
MKRLAFALLPALLAGCTGLLPPAPEGRYDSPAPALLMQQGQAGGVALPASAWSLTADNRAFRPGDVLTVTLEETTQASKSADTSFDKNSNATIAAPVLGTHTVKMNASLDAQRTFKGTGSSTQQNALQGSITVIVQQVLANGLLQVKGEKSLTLNQGEEVIRLSGFVRSGDIDTENRVSSLRIANAHIQYFGKGELADANNAGWLTRFFNSPWMPF